MGITYIDIPEDLKEHADRLGFNVEIAPQMGSYSAWIAPVLGSRGTIYLSGSNDPGPELRAALAHELGHAEQWNELG